MFFCYLRPFSTPRRVPPFSELTTRSIWKWVYKVCPLVDLFFLFANYNPFISNVTSLLSFLSPFDSDATR